MQSNPHKTHRTSSEPVCPRFTALAPQSDTSRAEVPQALAMVVQEVVEYNRLGSDRHSNPSARQAALKRLGADSNSNSLQVTIKTNLLAELKYQAP